MLIYLDNNATTRTIHPSYKPCRRSSPNSSAMPPPPMPLAERMRSREAGASQRARIVRERA